MNLVTTKYIIDLEKYCDELEKNNKEFEKEIAKFSAAYYRQGVALDLACSELEDFVISEIYGGDEEEWGVYPVLNKAQWKVWLTQDE